MTKIDSTHYFDWAATAPFDTEILQNALNRSFEFWGNPSSIYKPGTQAKNSLNEARDKIAKILGVDSKTLFFTSGGTESDHIPLLSILNRPEKGSVVVSTLEHPALREQINMLSHQGFNIIKVNPDKNGIINPKTLAQSIKEDTQFVTVMAVNNETGAVQPIKEIVTEIKSLPLKRKPKIHVDFVQALGKIPFDLKSLSIDSAAFSAHKIGGPRGIGLLYISNPQSVEPFLRGGGQEQNIRSGTENVFGALAFADCIEKYALNNSNKKMLERFEEQKIYINEFIQKLCSIKKCRIIPEERTDINFSDKNFSPWVLQASFEKIPGQVMVRALDSKGFFISTGSACSAKKNSRPILEAMNVPPAQRETAVRFSFGSLTTKQAMDELFNAVKEVCDTFK